MDEKTAALEGLRREMEADMALPLRGQAALVFGEGNPSAEVLFIGEAPGFHEDRLVRPFVGRAGQLLNQLLDGIKWPRESVYITNIVKRRPPENRDPLPEEISVYHPYLARQVEIISPKIIATLGRFSMAYFLPDAKISRDHGRVVPQDGRIIVPLYHPAAALRSSSVLRELEDDFRKLPALLRDWATLVAVAPAVAPEPETPKAEQVPLF